MKPTKTRGHAIEVGDRVYFENSPDDTGTVMDVWYGQPRDFPGGYRDHWRVQVQWDKNAHTGEAPGELSECAAMSTRPVRK